MIGRDPKWIAAQIGHVSPAFTFSVYQQVATRRYVDEQVVSLRVAVAVGQRVPSGRVKKIPAWLRTSLLVTGGSRCCCRRI
jgi:hypothetical protein